MATTPVRVQNRICTKAGLKHQETLVLSRLQTAKSDTSTLEDDLPPFAIELSHSVISTV